MITSEAKKLNVISNQLDAEPSKKRISFYREISSKRIEEFYSKGFKKRHFFPHKIYYLPKPGPDGYKIASQILGNINPAEMVEVVLYAVSPALDEFPKDLFFDDDVVWHQQQFGKTGQIATVSLLVDGTNLYSMIHLSDLVQRISYRREHKTRIENRFKGWPKMLLNSILNFALEKQLENVFTPTSELAIKQTDKERNVIKDLFERIYDLSVSRYYKTEKIDGWWKININDNREKIVIPEKKQEEIKKEKTICLAHDFEAGLGHMGVDSELVETANKNYMLYLKEMIEIEKHFKIPVTYNVVGSLLSEVREKISSGGHCIAFHSFDHNLNNEQLYKCKEVDYRIKGYRTPQSKITSELTIDNLLFNNFEWLASSVYSLKITQPKLEKGIVNIPIMFDDYSMYKDKVSYQDWENKAIQVIKENDFVAFCLHDCYAQYWLPHYKSFLNKICNIGNFRMLNQVADEKFLSNSL